MWLLSLFPLFQNSSHLECVESVITIYMYFIYYIFKQITLYIFLTTWRQLVEPSIDNRNLFLILCHMNEYDIFQCIVNFNKYKYLNLQLLDSFWHNKTKEWSFVSNMTQQLHNTLTEEAKTSRPNYSTYLLIIKL